MTDPHHGILQGASILLHHIPWLNYLEIGFWFLIMNLQTVEVPNNQMRSQKTSRGQLRLTTAKKSRWVADKGTIGTNEQTQMVI